MTKNISVVILGLGLIGGSIARRLSCQKSIANQINIHAWNHNSRPYQEAESLGIQTYQEISDIDFKKIDFIFICTPIYKMDDIFNEIKQILKKYKPEDYQNLIITDVASVKQMPEDVAKKYELFDHYVGLHPMYGTEMTGFENSTPNLGDNACWAVCLHEDGDPSANEVKTGEFIRQHLAGETVFVSAVEHDQAVALSSHLPHVLAYELAGIISDEDQYLASVLNASSFHGATRVAHGNKGLFEDMMRYNSKNVGHLLEKVIDDLTSLKDSLLKNNETRLKKDVHHFVERSNSFRNEQLEIDESELDMPLHKHDADGWVECTCGREHWGLNGAAGVFLVRAKDAKVTHILLQQRALWSAEGGTWGTPGGAISFNETPVEGALREAYEEAGVMREDVDVLLEITRDHGLWKYTTVIAKEKDGAEVIPIALDQESLDLKWVEVDKVKDLPLLTAFGKEYLELVEKANQTLNADVVGGE